MNQYWAEIWKRNRDRNTNGGDMIIVPREHLGYIIMKSPRNRRPKKTQSRKNAEQKLEVRNNEARN